MNNPFEGVRNTWENLNDRERRMFTLLGLALGLVLLLLPPVILTLDNQDLQARNAEFEATLDKLAMQRVKLGMLAHARKADEERYKSKTPSLGSFMEAKAKEQGLTLQEVTDQPSKTNGKYTRRSVTVSLPQVALTPVIQLLSSIVESPYPVAIDHIQIDHFQPGDQFNVKLGVLTFDKQVAGSGGKASAASGSGT